MHDTFMTTVKPSLSIIIPAHNELQRLPQTLEQLQTFFTLQSWNFEIIPVIQGDDQTSSLVCNLATKDPRIKPIIDASGRGKGRAVRAGIEQAQGSIILFIDASLSVPVQILAQLAERFESSPSYDIFIGSRQHPDSKVRVRQPWYCYGFSRLFNLFLRLQNLTPFRDTQCGCKFFRHDIAKILSSYSTVDGFAFDVEILLLAKNFGYRIQEVPVEWENKGSSGFRIPSDALQMLEDVWNLTEYTTPA